MDKLQKWLQRIQQPPRREVANLDYWELLAETRIAQEGEAVAEPAFHGITCYTVEDKAHVGRG